MTLFLVRHAKAGSRSRWTGADRDRPLSKAGSVQARELVPPLLEAVGDARIVRIGSSPYRRCVETVEPLAAHTGLPIDEIDALAEGSSLAETLALLQEDPGGTVVWCSHGDVIGDLLLHAAANGVVLDHPKLEKGSVWELALHDGAVSSARYLPPPPRA